MRPLTMQLGHVIETYIEIQRSAQMVKIPHCLTFLHVRSSETDNDHHPSPCVAGHRPVHQEKQLHFSKEPAQGC